MTVGYLISKFLEITQCFPIKFLRESRRYYYNSKIVNSNCNGFKAPFNAFTNDEPYAK